MGSGTNKGKLIGGAIGAVAGYAVGYGYPGMMIGMSLGGYLFNPKKASNKTRIHDLYKFEQDRKAPVPVVFGTDIAPGTYVWVGEDNYVKEVKIDPTDAGQKPSFFPTGTYFFAEFSFNFDNLCLYDRYKNTVLNDTFGMSNWVNQVFFNYKHIWHFTKVNDDYRDFLWEWRSFSGLEDYRDYVAQNILEWTVVPAWPDSFKIDPLNGFYHPAPTKYNSMVYYNGYIGEEPIPPQISAEISYAKAPYVFLRRDSKLDAVSHVSAARMIGSKFRENETMWAVGNKTVTGYDEQGNYYSTTTYGALWQFDIYNKEWTMTVEPHVVSYGHNRGMLIYRTYNDKIYVFVGRHSYDDPPGRFYDDTYGGAHHPSFSLRYDIFTIDVYTGQAQSLVLNAEMDDRVRLYPKSMEVGDAGIFLFLYKANTLTLDHRFVVLPGSTTTRVYIDFERHKYREGYWDYCWMNYGGTIYKCDKQGVNYIDMKDPLPSVPNPWEGGNDGFSRVILRKYEDSSSLVLSNFEDVQDRYSAWATSSFVQYSNNQSNYEFMEVRKFNLDGSYSGVVNQKTFKRKSWVGQQWLDSAEFGNIITTKLDNQCFCHFQYTLPYSQYGSYNFMLDVNDGNIYEEYQTPVSDTLPQSYLSGITVVGSTKAQTFFPDEYVTFVAAVDYEDNVDEEETQEPTPIEENEIPVYTVTDASYKPLHGSISYGSKQSWTLNLTK